VLRICRGMAGVNVVGGIVVALLSGIRSLSAFRWVLSPRRTRLA